MRVFFHVLSCIVGVFAGRWLIAMDSVRCKYGSRAILEALEPRLLLSASISGQKFDDLNANGVRDPGEPLLDGWTIELVDSATGQVIDNELTSGGGIYSFDDVVHGSYIVREVAQPGWVASVPDPSGRAVNLGPDETVGDIDFGNYRPVSISGLKFSDHNGDGVRDPGDEGLDGWTIELVDPATDNVIDTRTTSGGGFYSFEDIIPGDYEVHEVLRFGWVQTHPSQGSHFLTLASGDVAAENIDFGNYTVSDMIAGQLWNDLNADGVKDAGEPGLDGWTVELTDLLLGDTTTVVTAGGGLYSFDAFLPGSYEVRQIEQAGWIQTYPTDSAYYAFELDGGALGIDFGNVQAGSISGVKFNDLDGDGARDAGEPGLNGWTIELVDSATQQVVYSTVTAADSEDGQYEFADVIPGDYEIREVAQAGWLQTFPAVPAYVVALSSNDNLADMDFGNAQVGSISGQKFEDLDSDGFHDSGEPGLDGWTVELVDPATGLVVATVVTSSVDLDLSGDIDPETESGLYTFADVLAGDYELREVQQPNWVETAPGEATGRLQFVEREYISAAQFLEVSPDGQYMYTASYNSGIRVFRRDPLTGHATPVDQFGQDNARGLAISPDSRHVYLTADGGDRLYAYSCDPVTGELTQIQSLRNDEGGVGGMNGPRGLAISPDGAHAYVTGAADDAIAVFSRNSVTGQLTFIEAIFDGQNGVSGLEGVSSLTLSPDGSHVYTGASIDDALVAFQRNPLTGHLTFMQAFRDNQGGVDGLDGVQSLIVSPDGAHLYALGNEEDAVVVFSRNAVTGALTFADTIWNLEGDIDRLDAPVDIAITPDGNYAYVAAYNSSAVNVFTRDAATGQLTFTGFAKNGQNDEVDGLGGVRAISFSPEGSYVYTVSSSDAELALFTRDTVASPYEITLEPAEVLTAMDFGNTRFGPISGQKFHDLNGNGVHDSGEPGLDGWTIELVDPIFGQVIDTRVTASVDLDDSGDIDPETEAGLYSFEGLPPGDYRVREVLPASWRQTLPASAAGSEMQVAIHSDGYDYNYKGAVSAMAPSGDSVIVWSTGSTMYAQLFKANGVSKGDSFIVNANTQSSKSGPDVAMDAEGNFVVVWQDQTELDGSENGIFAQRYLADGTPDGGEFQVNVTTLYDQEYPVVAMTDSGEFVVAWASIQSLHSYHYDILARRYNSDGTAKEGEILVSANASYGYTAGQPEIAMNNTGAFVVTWRLSSSGNNALGQVVGADGTLSGDCFRREDNAVVPWAVAMAESGDFVAVSRGSGQIYTAEGVRRGPEFHISDGARPSVAVNSKGLFVVAYAYTAPDAYQEVFGRCFTFDGVAVGEEFRVSATADNDGRAPDIAINDNGDILVVWETFWHRGYYYGYRDVSARWYSGVGPGGFYDVSLVQGSVAEDLDFGNFVPASLSGQKFEDLDGDGFWDGGEPGLDGWTIELLDSTTGEIVDTQTTSGGGAYSFTGLIAGDYEIREVLQDGWIQTLPSPLVYSVSVDYGDSVGDLNFGNQAIASEIRGQKFEDLNANGVKDAGEPGLDGWTIELVDPDTGGVIDSIVTSSIDLDLSGDINPAIESGLYSFGGLRRGDYYVRETLQPGWTQSTVVGDQYSESQTQYENCYYPNVFTFDFVDGPPVIGDGILTVSAYANLSFSSEYLTLGAEGVNLGNLFVNNDGADYLMVTANINLAEEELLLWQADGAISFTVTPSEVVSNALLLQEEVTLKLAYTTAPVFYYSLSAAPGQVLVDNDFGNYRSASISGQKFEDIDGDGAKDDGEPGLDGWTIELVDPASDEVLDTQITSGGGMYSFVDLLPGDYEVRETGQAGWMQTYPELLHYPLTLVSGDVAADKDFGNVEFASISGKKFEDINANGVQDAGDPGLDGWTIELVDTASGQVVDTEMTAAGGLYSFAGVLPGDYELRDVLQTGWVQTYPAPGVHSVAIVSGSTIAGVDSGNAELVTVSGQKFADMNSNGVRDNGEVGLSGWTIELVDRRSGQVVATTLTGDLDIDQSGDIDFETERGLYEFTSVLPGDYKVREVLQDGWTPVYPAAIGEEFPVNTETVGDQKSPVVAVADSERSIVVWQSAGQDGDGDGIYAQMFHVDGTPDGAEFPVNTTAAGNQSDPAVAVDVSGNFVVVWTDDALDTGGKGVFARMFDAAGTPLTGEIPINSYVTGDQSTPTVAMDSGGGFTVAWTDAAQDGSAAGLYARRFTSAGLPATVEFAVNATADGAQQHPAVAVDASGTITVAWDSFGQDGSGYGVYVRQFAPSGSPLTAEMLVNTETASHQVLPSITAHSNGRFAIAWNSYNQDGDSYGVYAQRFNSDGSADGGEFRVNSETAGSQSSPSAAMDDSGNLAIVWASSDQDGDGLGVYGQLYNSDGSLNGGEFAVNSHTAGHQTSPVAAMSGLGRLTVAWASGAQDSDGYGVYARQQAAFDSPVHMITLISGLDIGGADFANYAEYGSIQGQKFHDVNVNHLRDPGEPGLDGWTIELIDPTTGQVLQTSVTTSIDLNGNAAIEPETEIGLYGFSGLLPGAYEVREVIQPGWAVRYPLAGSHTVVVTAEQLVADVDFGNAVNNHPAVQDSSVVIDEDAPFEGQLLGSDVDNDPLAFEVVNDPTNGTVAIAADGRFTYTPGEHYFGPDSFTFRAWDGYAYSNAATVSITVVSVDDAPVIGDVLLRGSIGSAFSSQVSASDPEGDPFTLTFAIQAGSGPEHGTVTSFDSSSGEFTYVADPGYIGVDSFVVQGAEGQGDSTPGTVSIVLGMWAEQSIREPLAGTLTQAGVTTTIEGSGYDIWNYYDEFHYAYYKLAGDGEIIAHVTDVRYTDGWAKAGVMIRDTLASDSFHAMAVVVPSGRAYYQYRLADRSPGISFSMTGDGTWLRLVRDGDQFTAYRSSDGTSWTSNADGIATISMGRDVYIGLPVTSHNTHALCTATFESVQIYGDPWAPTVTVDTLVTADSTPPLSGEVDASAATIQVSVDGNTYPAINNGDGTWTLADDTISPLPGLGTYDIAVVATNISGIGVDATVDELTVISSHVADRHVFYNNSAADGNDPAANAADDAAIDSGKAALLPGQTPRQANYSSYSRGINGIMIDIDGLAGVPTSGDFSLRISDPSDPSGWIAAPEPAISVRFGEGVGGADRVTLTWSDGEIINQWVEVAVLATGQTGLAEYDLFYFGNSVGDCDGDGTVGDGDYDVLVSQFGLSGNRLAADINRDLRVDLADFASMRASYGDTVALPAALPGDADLNGLVNDDDYEILISQFGLQGHGLAADMNGDRQVDLDDFAVVRANLDNTLPFFQSPAPAAAPTPSASTLGSGLVTSVNQSTAVTPLINTLGSTLSPVSAGKLALPVAAPQVLTIISQLSTQSTVAEDVTAPERELIGVLAGESPQATNPWLKSDELLADLLAEAADSRFSHVS
jgi:6-phosphogluconolactonase (cycloisomerase 2 family)